MANKSSSPDTFVSGLFVLCRSFFAGVQEGAGVFFAGRKAHEHKRQRTGNRPRDCRAEAEGLPQQLPHDRHRKARAHTGQDPGFRRLFPVQRRKGGQIALQTAGGVQLLNTEDIYWLETRDRMLHYHTSTGVWSVRSSLQNAEKQLAPYHFAKCNQCYLVNLRYVRAVQNDMVQVGEDRLEISRRQRAAFLAAVAAYVGGAM